MQCKYEGTLHQFHTYMQQLAFSISMSYFCCPRLQNALAKLEFFLTEGRSVMEVNNAPGGLFARDPRSKYIDLSIAAESFDIVIKVSHGNHDR